MGLSAPLSKLTMILSHLCCQVPSKWPVVLLIDAYMHCGGFTLLLGLLAGTISILPLVHYFFTAAASSVMHEALSRHCIMTTIIFIITIMSCPGITCLSNCNPQSECLLIPAAMSVISPVSLQEHSFGR